MFAIKKLFYLCVSGTWEEGTGRRKCPGPFPHRWAAWQTYRARDPANQTARHQPKQSPFSSVPDRWHFGVDPDPRIHASEPHPDPYLWLVDPDPGGQKTRGSGGSGTLPFRIFSYIKKNSRLCHQVKFSQFAKQSGAKQITITETDLDKTSINI